MKKKPLHSGGFFLCAVFLCLWLPELNAACKSYTSGKPAQVAWVYDGDTLKLEDGRKIRLIGINTPEMGRDGKSDESGAADATRQLQALVDASDRRLYVRPGRQKSDRYKRHLAHLYDSQGLSLSEQLLRQGTGYAIVIPPNLTNLACYAEAENLARAQSRGVWRRKSVFEAATTLQGQETGFHLLQGRISRVGKSRRSLWLDLQQGPSIRIDWSDWKYFKDWDAQALDGRKLEVRGWIYLRKGQQRLQVRHPASIRWLD